MAITAVTRGASGSTFNASNVVTGTWAPTAGNLILFWVFCSDDNADANPTTVTGLNSTWVKIGNWDNLGAHTRSWTLYAAMNASMGTGTGLTINWAVSHTRTAWWIMDDVSGAKSTGTNGSDAIIANAGSITGNTGNFVGGTNSGNSLTMSDLSSASNATFGAMRNTTNATVTVGSGYTGLQNSAPLSNRLASEYQVPGSATVNYTWSSQAVSSYLVGVEVAPARSGGLALVGVG